MSQRPGLITAYLQALFFASLVAVIGTAGTANARGDYHMLPLQKAGQASLTIDESARAAYIVDLGGVGDGKRLIAGGDSMLFEGKPLIDYLIVDRNVEHLVVTCSHPHSDHMGGIQALFRDSPRLFFLNGDPARPRFKSITVIDNGVPDSLAATYKTLGGQLKGPNFEFRHLSVTGPDGLPRNAYAELPFKQGDVRIENVAYTQSEKADLHGRAVITLTQLEVGTVSGILDPDDASTVAIDSAVAKLKAQGITAVDAFVVPHHGSRYHDSASILELSPKRAIISVNPSNQFGHPAAEVVENLIDKLGRGNVYFTGSSGGVAIGAEGVKALYSAAHPDTFALFFEQRLTKAEMKAAARATPQLKEEIAALKRIRDKIASAPRVQFGALDALLAERARVTGSIHSPEFEVGRVPLGGADAKVLTEGYIFAKPAKPVTYVVVTESLSDVDKRKIWNASVNADVRFQSEAGQPSPYLPDEPPPAVQSTSQPPDPAPKPGDRVAAITLGHNLLPDGGMVFLDGGRVEITGARTELTGARVVVCGSMACVRTLNGIDYQLPFTDLTLFREVLWRVNQGSTSFYLSINPRKRLLQPDFPIVRVPTGRLLSGPGRGGAEALNDVVTSGGIERSRIGDILWRADVAFKSKALGFDVLGGGRLPLDPKLFISDETSSVTDSFVSEGDRWCRLYWGSGAPKFTFVAPSNALPGRLTVTGNAVVANAEAMIPRAGGLQRFPAGTWCAREVAVAKSLQTQANRATTAGTLGELRVLAQMQAFALWTKRSGVQFSDFAAAPAPIAAIPGWTSGIRTANATVVRPERRILPKTRGYAIHVWSTNPNAESCSARVWNAFDDDMTSLKMQRREGRWAVGPESYGKLDAWAGSASDRIAKCAGGQAQPLVDNSDIDVSQGMAATIAPPKLHSLSSQLHGGVLLGTQKQERAFEQAYDEKGLLWAPDGTLLFKRVGDALHFWSPLEEGRGGQHVVVSRGTVKQIAARDGMLQFLVEARPGATVRSDLRASGNDEGSGLEWVGLWHGADGVPVVGKIAARCTTDAAVADCVDVKDGDLDAMLNRLETIGIQPALHVEQADGGRWTVRLDIRRLLATLRPADEVDPDAMITAASELNRWGFRAEAASVLVQALEAISPDAEDTILRSLILASQ